MQNKYIYDFEKPLDDIQVKINELKTTSIKTGVDITLKLNDLENRLKEESIRIYSSLTRWQKVQLARHPDRPHTKDYIDRITSYWFELHGDRRYADDKAIISGIAKIDYYKVVIILNNFSLSFNFII